MNKIKKIILCYFFEKMDYNPKDKINDLQEEFRDILDDSFVYSDEDIDHLFSVPRIQSFSKNKQILFQMSLINANLIMDVDDKMDYDDVILWINNYFQYCYDVIKEVFNNKIIYSSVKLEMIEETKNPALELAKKYSITLDLENFSINKGYIQDNYYINIIMNSSKEFNFNFNRNSKMTEHDLFDLTMITSLSDAKLDKTYIAKTIEVNDRFAFNQNRDYLSTKESIRGMIIELKKLLEKNEY